MTALAASSGDDFRQHFAWERRVDRLGVHCALGLLYVAVLQYVSFVFTEPCVMWLPPVMLMPDAAARRLIARPRTAARSLPEDDTSRADEGARKLRHVHPGAAIGG